MISDQFFDRNDPGMTGTVPIGGRAAMPSDVSGAGGDTEG
jgi:hypothetical protein